MQDERRGFLFLLAAIAVLAGALLMIDLQPSSPAGGGIGQPRYLEAYGRRYCTCTPMADGCYTAKHCLDPDPPPLSALTVDGKRVTAYTLDPYRDLAHIPLWPDTETVLGEPTDGLAYWYGMRQGTAIVRATQVIGGPLSWDDGTYVQRQRWDAWCYARDDLALPGIPALGDGDSPIKPGDSGGGFYSGGKLVGILSLFDPDGCSAWTVRVP